MGVLLSPQAVGPVAVTSILLGNGLANVFSDQKNEVGAGAVQAPAAALWSAGWCCLLGCCSAIQLGAVVGLLHTRALPMLHTGAPSFQSAPHVGLSCGLCEQVKVNLQDPNKPEYPELQMQYNHAAVQVGGCPRSFCHVLSLPFTPAVMHRVTCVLKCLCMRQACVVGWQPLSALGATCPTLNHAPV